MAGQAGSLCIVTHTCTAEAAYVQESYLISSVAWQVRRESSDVALSASHSNEFKRRIGSTKGPTLPVNIADYFGAACFREVEARQVGSN